MIYPFKNSVRNVRNVRNGLSTIYFNILILTNLTFLTKDHIQHLTNLTYITPYITFLQRELGDYLGIKIPTKLDQFDCHKSLDLVEVERKTV